MLNKYKKNNIIILIFLFISTLRKKINKVLKYIYTKPTLIKKIQCDCFIKNEKQLRIISDKGQGSKVK